MLADEQVGVAARDEGEQQDSVGFRGDLSLIAGEDDHGDVAVFFDDPDTVIGVASGEQAPPRQEIINLCLRCHVREADQHLAVITVGIDQDGELFPCGVAEGRVHAHDIQCWISKCRDYNSNGRQACRCLGIMLPATVAGFCGLPPEYLIRRGG